jgi:hypothetical protein
MVNKAHPLDSTGPSFEPTPILPLTDMNCRILGSFAEVAF